MVDVVAGAGPAFPPVHERVRLRVGGSAANAALAAVAAGADASVVGCVGDDAAGMLVEDELRAAGVHPLLTRDPAAPTGVVVATPAGIVADRGANARLAPADIPDPLEADAVLVAGWALLQPDTGPAATAALERARATWIAVDPASARLVQRFGPERFFEATASATAILADEDEAAALTGERTPDALAGRYPLACVKLGPAGAIAILDGRREQAAPRERIEGELFGAGDAFAGTLLAALAAGVDLRPALQQACDAGSAIAHRPRPL
jgi:sugar/nucleoside kinase (ribokinase family)